MPEFALAAAGAIIFTLTTWASLTFGYQAFQDMWESDLAEGAVPVHAPTEDVPPPLLYVDSTDGDARPSELVYPDAPAA